MVGEKFKSKELEVVFYGSLFRLERFVEFLWDWGFEMEFVLERVKLKFWYFYFLNVLIFVSGELEVVWWYFEWVRV